MGKSVSRKRGKYNHYDAEVKVKIAKYTCENGNKATVVRFSEKFGYPVKESSVRNFKCAYLEKLK